MKKIIVIIMSVAMLVVACGKTESKEVRVSGSSSVSPLMTKLAEGFEKQNAKYAIIVETTDSTVGVQDTIDGKNEIGMASRDIKPNEAEKVDTMVLCQDGLALIVNKSANVSAINKTQLTDLYIKNTSIGSISKAVSREDGSGTRDAFASLTAIGKGSQLPQTVEILDGTGKVKTAVANDTAKLGYISLGSVDDTIKVLAYNDGSQTTAVMASADNIKNGSYKLYRPFVLITKKGAILTEGARAFLTFIESDAGQKIIMDNGYISIK